MKYIFILIALLTITYNGLLLYVNAHIDEKDHSGVYNDPHAIWSSRGIYNSHAEQNSIKSVKKAFEVGYIGVEIDCYYDVKRHQFIVSHERNKKDSKGYFHYNLKEGELLTLEKLLSEAAEGHYFWIDYKNLDNLNTEETLQSIAQLHKISMHHHLKERIYIEGSTPTHLLYYAKAGYKTLFAFGPLKNNHIFSSLSSNFYKIIYYFYDFSAIAIHYGSIDNPKYGKDSQRNLKGIPTFLFHVPNDSVLLDKLMHKKEVRVVLVGRGRHYGAMHQMYRKEVEK